MGKIMKKYLFISLTLLLMLHQNGYASFKKLNTATNCQTLTCVRNEIDVIDEKIVVLIAQRLAYVKKAGELKKNRKIIHDCARERDILNQARKQAEKLGFSGSIAVEIFRTILAQSNLYELKYHTFRN